MHLLNVFIVVLKNFDISKQFFTENSKKKQKKNLKKKSKIINVFLSYLRNLRNVSVSKSPLLKKILKAQTASAAVTVFKFS